MRDYMRDYSGPYSWRDLTTALRREYHREQARAALLEALAFPPRLVIRPLSLEELYR